MLLSNVNLKFIAYEYSTKVFMLLFSFAAITKTESVSSSLSVYGKTGLIYCNQTVYFFHCHDE